MDWNKINKKGHSIESINYFNNFLLLLVEG
jgi:hypothetical protein